MKAFETSKNCEQIANLVIYNNYTQCNKTLINIVIMLHCVTGHVISKYI